MIVDWQSKRDGLRIGIGTDHGGLAKKEWLKTQLAGKGIELIDYGPYSADPEIGRASCRERV